MKRAKREETELVRSTVRIPRPLWTKLGHLAVDMGKSRNDVILEAVAEYIRKESARG